MQGEQEKVLVRVFEEGGRGEGGEEGRREEVGEEQGEEERVFVSFLEGEKEEEVAIPTGEVGEQGGTEGEARSKEVDFCWQQKP